MILQGCEEPSNSTVRFQGSTLREVLDDIVTADPDYRWEVKDGVVNLVPAKGVPDLLTLRISAFDSGDATSVRTAETFLFALPRYESARRSWVLTEPFQGQAFTAVVPGARPPRIAQRPSRGCDFAGGAKRSRPRPQARRVALL